eukprot:8979835-Lingulodinium_polyedra.AAC.1
MTPTSHQKRCVSVLEMYRLLRCINSLPGSFTSVSRASHENIPATSLMFVGPLRGSGWKTLLRKKVQFAQ